MISIIMGQKGSGKTKAFIEMVNNSASEEKGTVICIVKGDKHSFYFKPSVRLVNTEDFDLDSYKVFYGFICGIISRDYDITHIFIDSVSKIANSNLEKFSGFIEFIEKLSQQFNIKFTMTISADPSSAPEKIKKYLIEY
mgnify:CR=1 FL=1